MSSMTQEQVFKHLQELADKSLPPETYTYDYWLQEYNKVHAMMSERRYMIDAPHMIGRALELLLNVYVRTELGKNEENMKHAMHALIMEFEARKAMVARAKQGRLVQHQTQTPSRPSGFPELTVEKD